MNATDDFKDRLLAVLDAPEPVTTDEAMQRSEVGDTPKVRNAAGPAVLRQYRPTINSAAHQQSRGSA